MHRDKINTVPAVLFYPGEEFINRHLDDGSVLFYGRNRRLVDGHGADGHRGVAQDGPPDGRYVTAGAQVHHRIRPGLHRHPQFLQLGINIAVVRRGADIGVGLGTQPLADAQRGQILVIDVGRDDDGPLRHPTPHHLGVDILVPGYRLHLGRGYILLGQLQLRHNPPPIKNLTKGNGIRTNPLVSVTAASLRSYYRDQVPGVGFKLPLSR